MSGGDDQDPPKTAVKASAAAILARVLVMNTNYLARLTSEPSLSSFLPKSGVPTEENVLLCLVDIWLDKVSTVQHASPLQGYFSGLFSFPVFSYIVRPIHMCMFSDTEFRFFINLCYTCIGGKSQPKRIQIFDNPTLTKRKHELSQPFPIKTGLVVLKIGL